MDEFYLKHDKPDIIQYIDMAEFQRIEFWKNVVKQIPPLIRKLAEYYHIPSSEYPIIEITFNDERWEKWALVFGKRHKLGVITGGTYFTKSNRIELNPYIYLFEGGEEFVSNIYHELVHWIIQKVDYLNETDYDNQHNLTYHLLDFSMIFDDIYDRSNIKKEWNNYRFLKQHDPGFNIYMKDEQTLHSMYVHPSDMKGSEYYTGSFLAVENNFCIGFPVDC